MDAVAGLLDGPRARDAFLLRSSMDPPWSLRIQDEAPLTLVAMVRGEAWVVPDGARAVALHGGDVAVILGPGHYTVAHDPAEPPQAIIHPGQVCTTLDGEELAEQMEPRRADVGQRAGRRHGDAHRHIRAAQRRQPAAAARAADAARPARAGVGLPGHPLLADEIVKEDAGQEAVLDRLLDLLSIAVLRAWFDRPEADPPGWYRAYGDPVVGHALRLLHHNPAHPWTVAELAHETARRARRWPGASSSSSASRRWRS
jgi:hypothetical protein